MGEIGYDRHEFLYDLKLWEINAIIRGYRRRSRSVWESSRLNAFFIMSAFSDLKKAGINYDTDLIRFPWETEEQIAASTTISDEEIERMRELMRQENAAYIKRKEQEQKQPKGV